MKNTLNEQIRAVRRELNLTQENVAKELNISYQLYQKYERGERKISADLLLKIADAMNVSVVYIQEKELLHIQTMNPNSSINNGYNTINIDIDKIAKLIKEINESNLKYLEKMVAKILKRKD